MDPMLPPALRQPSIETIFLEPCDAFESLNMEKFLTNPWSAEETNTSAATSTAADPNPATPIHRQGSPTLSLPRPLHWKIVEKVWAKIQEEGLPLMMNVGGAQRVHDSDAPPLSSSPSPYEIAASPMEVKGSTLGQMTSVACGGRMEMSDFAVQQVRGESLLTAGLGPCNGEGMEWERGRRGKKGKNETEEKEIERRMKKLIRSRESAARFHAKKQEGLSNSPMKLPFCNFLAGLWLS
ncbi:ABSCISIC ACID-INSENSITIVE 5-like protein 1 [Phoenix dactylifera]|uniref:ABSCISIC ACID-INSENSITIVE 5-like protein 1 n=1 Tax=Phoenix dactylifera TaxID=42345 RepID=A0A8B9AW80_PHODC|nr:ABSCISIC ACID-INSENSITIVE 5-like protein 1 [Phoenix dactylifera]